MKYKTRADLLIAAGESIKMQEKAGIEPELRVCGEYGTIGSCIFLDSPSDYEFPLAVVEGKPVFSDDYVYSTETGTRYRGDELCLFRVKELSWNPPKPKTVMVELLRGDVKALAYGKPIAAHELNEIIKRRQEACRKALEDDK